MNVSIEDLRARLAAIGQEHILAFWAGYDEAERERFLAETASLDFDLIRRLAHAAKHPQVEAPGALEPPAVVRAGASDAAAVAHGRTLLKSGKVAFVLVAGGQATRLGYDLPKGCYPIGPVSRRSLFEMHADRLRAIGRRSGHVPLWFVMTSPGNHAATISFFEERSYFRIPKDRIVLFPQATVPAFDLEGRLVLESRTSLFRNPDGHGGTLWALRQSGFLNRCRAEGVEHLFYWQVDNPLVRLGDPLFLGLHARDARTGMSSKVVAKRGPGEKVGVLARTGGRTICVEYSDLPSHLRDARDDSGELSYRAGNIAIHALRVDFVERVTRGGLQLPWHRAEKKIRAIGPRGEPTELRGIKFETFIFDALRLSESTVTQEVHRTDEFAPVKNAEGEDSPATSRAAISYYYDRWIRKAGLAGGGRDAPSRIVEVHPMYAFDFEEFAARAASLPRPLPDALYLDEAAR